MSQWKDSDEVTTTFGSIKRNHQEGIDLGIAMVVRLLKISRDGAILKKLESSEPLKIAGHFAIEHALTEIIEVLEVSSDA